MGQRTAVTLVVGALALGACAGGDDVPVAEVARSTTTTAPGSTSSVEPVVETTAPPAQITTAPTVPPTTAVEGEADAEAFLRALFSYEIAQMDEAIAMTLPGSVASHYAIWQRALAEIFERDGWPSTPSRVTVTDGRAMVCTEEVGADCAAYSDFIATDGLIASFTVDGNDLAPRLGPSGPAITSGPVTAAVIGSYRTVQGDALGIIVNVTSSERVDLGTYSASYVGPDGRQSSPSEVTGPHQLVAGATADVVMFFARSDPGGRLILEMYNSDTYVSIPFEFEIPILAQ